MGRLIDADAFKRQIAGMTIANSYSVNKANALCELIDAQPIAYDVDAVVKQLEAVDNQIEIQYENNYEKAVEIVKGGGVDGN